MVVRKSVVLVGLTLSTTTRSTVIDMKIRTVAILTRNVEVDPKDYDGSVILAEKQRLQDLMGSDPAAFVESFYEFQIEVWEVKP